MSLLTVQELDAIRAQLQIEENLIRQLTAGAHKLQKQFTGVGNTEAARHGAVRNGADMLFGPLPDGLTVRRSPCLLPDVE